MADEHRSAARRAAAAADAGSARARSGREAVPRPERRGLGGPTRRPRRARRSEVQGRRSDRPAAAHRRRQEGPGRGQGGVEAARRRPGGADPARRGGGACARGGGGGRRAPLAARGAGALGAALVTVHASGGVDMIAAARRGLRAGAAAAGVAAPKLLAVTVLTSLAVEDLRALGFAGTPAEAALRLARMAMKAGADGLVCSPEEVAHLRRELGPSLLLVVPGIRPAGAASSDQRRTGTPRSAVQ